MVSVWAPFYADLLGLAGSDEANSKAVQRALNNYEFDSITIGRHLFEFKRGGGKSKATASYGTNFLNQAALWIVRELLHSPSPSANLTALIDELVPEAINEFIPRRLTKIPDLGSKAKVRRKKRSLNPTGGSLLLNGHFCPPSEKCESALDLITRGFLVFPLHSATDQQCSCKHSSECPSPGKHPRVSGWIQAASTNSEVVRLWWSKWPDANIAIKTGTQLRSGGFFAALDVDRRSFGHGSLACWIEEIGGDAVTETFTVAAGDGSHFYYSVPELLSCSAGQLGRGLDIKCQHGYVVAPGSVHRNGTLYTILSDTPIAPMPADMFNHLRSTGGVRETVHVGDRHNFLMRCARRLAHEGFDPWEIHTTLVDRMTRFCETGGRTVSDAELARLAEWAHNVEYCRKVQTEVA